MRSLGSFVAASLVLVVVAGCLSEGDLGKPQDQPPASAFPRLRCLDGALESIQGDWTNGTRGCNVEATPTNLGNEVTIAVNPKDPNNVVAGAKDYTQPYAGECVWDGIYSTTDGGATWVNQNVPGSNWARLENPSEPVTALSKHWCATDPVVAFGPNGEAYYAAMGYQCDPVTASKTGAGVLPQGGLNDWAFNCVQMYVLRSDDGGITWPRITPLDPPGAYPAAFHDREWLAVDPHNGNVYIGWISANGNWFYRSTDKGATFEGPIIIDGSGGQGTMIAPGPNNDVYVTYSCGNTELVVSHDGGQTFDAPVEVPVDCDASVLYPSEEFSRGEPRTPDAPFPAVDYSKDSPYSGNIYVVSRTARWGGADIGFTKSSDGGATWSKLAKLNDDADGNASQFFAAIGVNPNGVIDVIWYDQRNDPNHYLLDVYYTYSLDGGHTWAPNARVTEVSSDPKHSHHQNGMVFIGDYIDIDSSVDFAHPVWVDTRNGTSDVYTAWIERPSSPLESETTLDS